VGKKGVDMQKGAKVSDRKTTLSIHDPIPTLAHMHVPFGSAKKRVNIFLDAENHSVP
jgi:hypothetical protein